MTLLEKVQIYVGKTQRKVDELTLFYAVITDRLNEDYKLECEWT